MTYVEIDYQDGTPAWDGDPMFDSVDFGVELELGTGRLVSLRWDAEFAPADFGMTVLDGRIERDDVSRWNAGTSARWVDVLHRRILGCSVVWKRDRGLDDVDYDFPQAIELAFDDGRRMLLTASEFEREWDWGADHVTVIRLDRDACEELVSRIGIHIE